MGQSAGRGSEFIGGEAGDDFDGLNVEFGGSAAIVFVCDRGGEALRIRGGMSQCSVISEGPGLFAGRARDVVGEGLVIDGVEANALMPARDFRDDTSEARGALPMLALGPLLCASPRGQGPAQGAPDHLRP